MIAWASQNKLTDDLMFALIDKMMANSNLEKAVKRGDAQGVRKALGHGADPNLELCHTEALPYASLAIAGAWGVVRDGNILKCAMEMGFDGIGALLADAGARVPFSYHDRIVAARWQHRLSTK